MTPSLKIETPEQVSQTFRSVFILEGKNKVQEALKIHLPIIAYTTFPTAYMLIKNYNKEWINF